MKTIFFGSDAFSLPSLRALAASRHPVLAVVTTPAQPAGRGQRLAPTVVETFAQGKAPCLALRDLKGPDAARQLAAFGADCFVVVSYGKILPAPLLSLPRVALNVHPSLLPKYRGPAPIAWALLAGETRLGVSVMEVGPRVDAGAIFKQEACDIGADSDAVEVHELLAQRGARLLLSVLDELAAGRDERRQQDDAQATYARKLTKEDGRMDWVRSAGELHNQVRALKPWPMAFTTWKGKRVLVHRTRVGTGTRSGGEAGTVVDVGGGAPLRVAAGEGILEVLELQPEGRSVLTADAFANGYRVAREDRFG